MTGSDRRGRWLGGVLRVCGPDMVLRVEQNDKVIHGERGSVEKVGHITLVNVVPLNSGVRVDISGGGNGDNLDVLVEGMEENWTSW